MIKKIILTISLNALSLPTLACVTPSSYELQKAFKERSWVRVQKNNQKKQTAISVKVQFNFQQPSQFIVYLNGRRTEGSGKVCKATNGKLKVHAKGKVIELNYPNKNKVVTFRMLPSGKIQYLKPQSTFQSSDGSVGSEPYLTDDTIEEVSAFL